MRSRGDNVILRAGVKRPTPSLGQSNHYGLESAKPAPQSMFEKAAARQWAVVEQPTRSAEGRFLAFRPFIGLILKGSKGSILFSNGSRARLFFAVDALGCLRSLRARSALDGVSWVQRGSVEIAVSHWVGCVQQNRRRRLLPPWASLLLGARFGLLSRGLRGLGRCELRPVSQHRVHDDRESASQGDASLPHR